MPPSFIAEILGISQRIGNKPKIAWSSGFTWRVNFFDEICDGVRKVWTIQTFIKPRKYCFLSGDDEELVFFVTKETRRIIFSNDDRLIEGIKKRVVEFTEW